MVTKMAEEKNSQVKTSKKAIIIIAIIAVLIVVALLVKGITAYLTATDSKINTFTVGSVSISLLEPQWDNLADANNNGIKDLAENITAKQTVTKDPQVKNTGRNEAYVYLKVKVPKAKISQYDSTTSELFTYSVNEGWTALADTTVDEQDYIERVYYYSANNAKLAPNATTPALFNSVTFANIKSLPQELQLDEELVEITAYAIQTNNIDGITNEMTTAQKVKKAYETYFAQEAEEEAKNTVNLFSSINSSNYAEYYGQYVDLGTNLINKEGTDFETDWRIFYKDTNGVWLISSDYVPNSTNKASNLGLQTNGTYGICSRVSRDDLIGRLDGTIAPEGTSWTQEIIPVNLQSKGVTAKGAVDLPMWVNSWNNLYGGTADELQISDNVANQRAPGYVIGRKGDTLTKDNTSISLSSASGYNNTLYYPHKEGVENCYGYWVASPSATSSNYGIGAYSTGGVSTYDYGRYDLGARLAVYLPSNIRFKLVNGVYQIAD